MYLLMVAYAVTSTLMVLQGQWLAWVGAFIGLYFLQWVSIFTVCRQMRWRLPNLVAVLIYTALYPAYVIVFGLMSLNPKYKWKGRKVGP